MIVRNTFDQETVSLPDGRVLRKQRCAQGEKCFGHGWVTDDQLTLQVSTNTVGPRVKFLHFSLSYAKKQMPSAA